MADLYVPDLMSKMINGVQYIPKSCDLASNSKLDHSVAKISFWLQLAVRPKLRSSCVLTLKNTIAVTICSSAAKSQQDRSIEMFYEPNLCMYKCTRAL